MNWYDQLPAEMYGGTAKSVPKSSAIGNLPPTGVQVGFTGFGKGGSLNP